MKWRMKMDDELKMLREDIDSLTETLNSMSKLVLAHDDTVTRLTLEMKAMKELMITPDDFDYLGCLKSTYEKHVTNQENEDG